MHIRLAMLGVIYKRPCSTFIRQCLVGDDPEGNIGEIITKGMEENGLKVKDAFIRSWIRSLPELAKDCPMGRCKRTRMSRLNTL